MDTKSDQVIYLDNNSTTPVAEDVVRAMTPHWREQYGNPSSFHRLGQAARYAVDVAREQLARLIGAPPRELIFTGSGTESDNLAILGTLAAYPTKRRIVTTAVEHPAVRDLCRRLDGQGYQVTFIGVDSLGRLDLDAFAAALDDQTAVANVMYANNETGVILPIREAAALCAARGVPLHVDAVQALGKIEIDVKSSGAALMSFSAHKLHGPKGVGALWVARGARLRSVQVGGPQERELRPGTENVAGIVGFGAAARLAAERLSKGPQRLREPPQTPVAPPSRRCSTGETLAPITGETPVPQQHSKFAPENGWFTVASLRDRLELGILERVSPAHVIGDRASRLPNTTNIAFEALQAEAILVALSEAGVCASAGSACSSGSLEPSHVLEAMGIDRRIAHGAIRFSLSSETTAEEIDRALEIIPDVIARLSSLGGPAANVP